MLKKVVIWAIVLIVLFVLVLNSGMIAEQAIGWVQDHPKDPDAPEVLYKTGRWCDIIGDTKRSFELYSLLYQDYPERSDLCAPALYHLAEDMVNSSYIVGVKKQALPWLDIIQNQYSTQEEWREKAKQLEDEVNYVH